jgi:ring-1,2-phenylacetyl-CoA epoxidase subunit PaaD
VVNLAQIETLLDAIPDPEIPVVSIRELGILRDIRLNQGALEIVITPTYSGCPAMEQIEDDIHTHLARHGLKATVRRQLSPGWTTDWMSPQAREKLRQYGIAPPHTQAAAEQPVHFMTPRAMPAVACPHCGSANTTETSHFGSTACKALFRCLDCREPFDYFKPY